MVGVGMPDMGAKGDTNKGAIDVFDQQTGIGAGLLEGYLRVPVMGIGGEKTFG